MLRFLLPYLILFRIRSPSREDDHSNMVTNEPNQLELRNHRNFRLFGIALWINQWMLTPLMSLLDDCNHR